MMHGLTNLKSTQLCLGIWSTDIRVTEGTLGHILNLIIRSIVSGQLHALAAVPPGDTALLPTG